MTKKWKFDYYAVHGNYHLVRHETIVELPDGYLEKAQDFVKKTGGGWNGNQGVLWVVRGWGADLFPLDVLTREQCSVSLPPKSNKTIKTFVIGSKRHPFRAYAPSGKLMGTYDCWADEEDGKETIYRMRKHAMQTSSLTLAKR